MMLPAAARMASAGVTAAAKMAAAARLLGRFERPFLMAAASERMEPASRSFRPGLASGTASRKTPLRRLAASKIVTRSAIRHLRRGCSATSRIPTSIPAITTESPVAKSWISCPAAAVIPSKTGTHSRPVRLLRPRHRHRLPVVPGRPGTSIRQPRVGRSAVEILRRMIPAVIETLVTTPAKALARPAGLGQRATVATLPSTVKSVDTARPVPAIVGSITVIREPLAAASPTGRARPAMRQSPVGHGAAMRIKRRLVKQNGLRKPVQAPL